MQGKPLKPWTTSRAKLRRAIHKAICVWTLAWVELWQCSATWSGLCHTCRLIPYCTWTPTVCKTIAQSHPNSPTGLFFAYLWGLGPCLLPHFGRQNLNHLGHVVMSLQAVLGLSCTHVQTTTDRCCMSLRVQVQVPKHDWIRSQKPL